MSFLKKYKPETRVEKKTRLLALASAREAGRTTAATTSRPYMLKFGLNHVTDLIEMKRARLVIIAHDVDPIETVVCLPALCRKKDVPYCIVKSKSRLGQLVHKKTATCIAVDNVRKEDQAELDTLCKMFRAEFNENTEMRRRWGGGILGIKSKHAQIKTKRAFAKEQSKKLGL